MNRDLWLTLWGVGLALAIQILYEGINEYPNLSNGFWIGLVINSFILAILILKRGEKPMMKKETEEPKATLVEPKNDEEEQRKKYINSPLLLEYQMTQQMHNYYGRLSWEIASILIAGSFALVGFSLQSPLMTKERFFGIAIAVTLVIVTWLSLFTRIAQLVDIHVARLLQIEKELHFHQHTYVHEAHEKRHVIVDGKCYDLSGIRGRHSVYLLMLFLVLAVWLIAFLL